MSSNLFFNLWYESGLPEILIENPNGGQFFVAKIKSIPEAYHVQWKVKRNGHEEFSLIDIKDPDYEGTSNSIDCPVLVVKKKELLENQCYHIKVDNFIGSSIKEIFGKKMFWYESLYFVWNVQQIIFFYL